LIAQDSYYARTIVTSFSACGWIDPFLSPKRYSYRNYLEKVGLWRSLAYRLLFTMKANGNFSRELIKLVNSSVALKTFPYLNAGSAVKNSVSSIMPFHSLCGCPVCPHCLRGAYGEHITCHRLWDYVVSRLHGFLIQLL
jgi:hypothetical protein